MKLLKPRGVISQPFAFNSNPSYKNAGEIGHPGIDFVSGWKEMIFASAPGKIYKIVNKGNPDLMAFRGVFQLVEDTGIVYEICYGHELGIFVEEGDVLIEGQPIGEEGNTGECWSAGKKVELEEKQNGSKAGTHLHYQVRPCWKVKELNSGRKYLTRTPDYQPYYDGYYYEIICPDNGFAGCIDPSYYFYTKSNSEFLIFWQKVVDYLKNL